MNFPAHKAGMFIAHNEYLGYYQSVEEGVAEIDDADWVSDEERQRALKTGSIWRLQWYPDTPIGSYTVAASTLDACLQASARLAAIEPACNGLSARRTPGAPSG